MKQLTQAQKSIQRALSEYASGLDYWIGREWEIFPVRKCEKSQPEKGSMFDGDPWLTLWTKT
jgi:hypothetical protein